MNAVLINLGTFLERISKFPTDQSLPSSSPSNMAMHEDGRLEQKNNKN